MAKLKERWKAVLAIENGKAGGSKARATVLAKQKTFEVLSSLDEAGFNEKLLSTLPQRRFVHLPREAQRGFLQELGPILNDEQKQALAKRLKQGFSVEDVGEKLNHLGGITNYIKSLLPNSGVLQPRRDEHLNLVSPDSCEHAGAFCLVTISLGLFFTANTDNTIYTIAGISACVVVGAHECL